MPSTTALQWLLGASLGLGVVDLVVINAVLAPDVVADTVVPDKVAPATPAVRERPEPRVAAAAAAQPPAMSAGTEASAVPAAGASLPADTAPAAKPAAAAEPAADAEPADAKPAADAPATVAEPAVAEPVVATKRVYFATMSAGLDVKARTVLDAITVRGTRIVIEGHADERGEDFYNKKLSKKRAIAVEQYLIARGVERARITVRYHGETGADDPDLWRDRRVDIQITGGPR